MHRWVALLALAACEPPAAPAEDAPIAWMVPPPPSGFPLGVLRGRLGRSQPPQLMVELGITGPRLSRAGSSVTAAGSSVLSPLHRPTVWEVPGAGPARAAVAGVAGDRAAIDLVDVDAGRVVWRDGSCGAPIVAVTADVIVCADHDGTRAIDLAGAPRWQTTAPFRAATGERIVVGGAGEVGVLAVASGEERTRITLPRGVPAEAIIASCDDTGRELFAVAPDGKLVRIADAKGAPAIAWAVAVGGDGEVVAVSPFDGASARRGAGRIAACDGDTVVVDTIGPSGPALVAIARSTGKPSGRVDGVRGWWAARDGSARIEVATAAGVASYARDLSGAATTLLDVPLGPLIAERGDHRLVRATPSTVVELDRAGVRAYVALAATTVALGDAELIATGATGATGATDSPSETVHRLALPSRWNRRLRLPALHRGVAASAELRDLPPVVPLDVAHAAAQPDTGMRGVAAAAIDPADGAAIYAVAVDRPGERAAVARADLTTARWRWQRVDGCGPGTPIGVAVADDVVVCASRGAPAQAAPAARGTGGATIRATSRDGVARWDWTGDGADGVDSITAGGDAILVHDAGRLTVLDARDGQVRGHIASDDGGPVRASAVACAASGGDRVTFVITAERGRIVARLAAAGLLPVWSVAVAGVVRALAPSGAGVLVVLEDGDAYRIDAHSAAIVALPGLGLGWHAAGDLVVGDTLGGPIPAPAPPPPPLTAAQMLRRPLQILRAQIDTPPPMSTPIAPPPPLGTSWQLTLYEPAGGLRARNDYAVEPPVAAPAVRGPAGSPIVVAYGPGLREVVVIDPRTGAPQRRARLPDATGAVFGTVVDGSPVAGAVLGSPLRVVVF